MTVLQSAPAITPSRQRVLDAISHRQPDRVPLDFGSTSVTGIHVSCVAALRDHYGLEKRPVKVHEPFQMLGLLDEDLKQAMGIDVEGVFRRRTMFGFENRDWKPWTFNGLDVLVAGKFNTTTDENGDTLIYPQGDLSAEPSGRMPKGFHFFDAIIRQKHLDPERLNVEDNLEEFGPLSQADLDTIKADVEAARATGRAIIANFGGMALGDIALVPAPFLKDPRGIRDVSEWYMSLKSRRDYVERIFERQTEIAMGNLERVYRTIGNSVDIVFICGTDFGTQTSAFCSVPTFRELWLPYYKQMCDWVHAHTTWKCFKHSCGSVRRFYESFAEAGLEIVNPVQCSATGMEPEALKRDFGDVLTFWGGGVDTQKTLPFGTPAEVRDQVLGRCEAFAPGGGFVFNTIHNIQAGTPVENIVAMLDAVSEFNGRA
ncbi:MAG: uroporphyrinogen decarboxylase family protein [Isosphaeraceae bacterium]